MGRCVKELLSRYKRYIVPVLKLNEYFEWTVQEKLNFGGKNSNFVFSFFIYWCKVGGRILAGSKYYITDLSYFSNKSPRFSFI